jgi:hypothetical protein
MSGNDPSDGAELKLKEAELKLKELEVELKQRELAEHRRFDLGRAAVIVTILGGIAAILFQSVGVWRASIEKSNAELRAASDFDFKGLELFIREQDHLITCDYDSSARNLNLFKSLFSEKITSGFNEIVSSKNNQCGTARGNTAAQEVKSKNGTLQDINAAADAARYDAIAQRSSLLAVTQGSGPLRVFIHINSDSDRRDAVALQTALIQKGYSAPGIELVSTAPEHYELRPYHSTQIEEAKAVAAIATDQLRLNSSEVRISKPLDAAFKSLPQNTMEFWFPRRTDRTVIVHP